MTSLVLMKNLTKGDNNMFGLLKWLLIGSGAAYLEHTVSGGDDDDC